LVDEINPLPVTWLGFNAFYASEGMGRLEWVTASEVNASHYEIEHSMNTNDWEVIGETAAVGNT